MTLSLETRTGEAVEEATLQGKVVALYFSSSWCKLAFISGRHRRIVET